MMHFRLLCGNLIRFHLNFRDQIPCNQQISAPNFKTAPMLKSLKSLFIVDEESESVPTKKGAEAKTGESQTGKVVTPVQTGPGKRDQKFMDVLFVAMEQNNLPGFDYLEYKKSLQSLAKMPMDVATKYQSAFAMAQTMGVTAPALIQTAQHYLDVLQKEEQKFEQALANQEKNRINSKEEQLKTLEQGIQKKSDQIKALTAEIQKDQEMLGQLKNEISESALKMESTKKDFAATYGELVDQIKADLNNMKQFLK